MKVGDEERVRLMVDHGLDRSDLDRRAGQPEVDQEQAQSVGFARDLVRAPGSGEEEQQVRMLEPRGEDFLTVDDVAISLLAGEGRDSRRVAPGFRFRDRHRLEPQAAAGDLRKVAPFLGFGAMSQKRAHGVHLGMAGRSIPAGGVDLLQDDARLDDPEPGPAVLCGDQDGQPAAVAERQHELLRIALLGVDRPPVRVGKFRADLPDCCTIPFLIITEAEVHQRWCRIRRARRTTASSTIWPSRAYAPRPTASASPAEATMPRAQVTSLAVGEKTWLTVSTCDGWMSNMPPKPSSRA